MAEENLQFTPKIVQHLSQLIDHEFGDDVKTLEKVEELLQDAVKRRDKLKTDVRTRHKSCFHISNTLCVVVLDSRNANCICL